MWNFKKTEHHPGRHDVSSVYLQGTQDTELEDGTFRIGDDLGGTRTVQCSAAPRASREEDRDLNYRQWSPSHSKLRVRLRS